MKDLLEKILEKYEALEKTLVSQTQMVESLKEQTREAKNAQQRAEAELHELQLKVNKLKSAFDGVKA